MIDLLVVTLLQAVAGEPAAPPPAPEAPAASSGIATSPSPAAAAGERLAEGDQPQADEPDVIRCRTVPEPGSRLGKRRCSTRRQDEETRERLRRNLERAQTQRGMRSN